jgi:hypothetical protein
LLNGYREQVLPTRVRKRNKVKTPRQSKAPTIDECDVPYCNPMDDENDDDKLTITDKIENNEDTEPSIDAGTYSNLRRV